MKKDDTLKKGKNNIKMIVLSILQEQDCYGYQISQLITEYSDGNLMIPEGSLYPALYTLEEEGYISSKKVLVGKRQERVYYHLEEDGKVWLAELISDFYRMNGLIDKIITKASDVKGGFNEQNR